MSAEEMSKMAKANSDAMMSSLQTATQGYAQMAQALAQFTQNMTQMSMAAWQAASQARDLNDMTELQSDFAKTSMEALMENSSRLTEMALKIANDASQPLSKRMNETMQEMNKRAA